jgi:hypothetical protein
MMAQIERIEQTALRPHQIRALMDLVSNSYGLKMFDIVEGAKRQLSEQERATIHLDGKGFEVYEPVTRAEFEGIIGPEIRIIEDYLDNLLREADLTPDDIDVVIRTGGSSQIPAFVQMLEARFGREKVRSLDTFSSVTSGLGIIGHRIERGEIEVEGYRRSDFPPDAPIETKVPAVEFDVLKKYVTLTEERADDPASVGTIALTGDGKVRASNLPPEQAELAAPQMIAAAPDEPILIMTSEYRFLMKSALQLGTLSELGLTLEQSEGFHSDAFGTEYASGIAEWRLIKPDAPALLLSTSGYFKAYKGATLIEHMEQPSAYQMPRIKGDPFALIGGNGEVFAFNTTGRALRVPVRLLADAGEGRLMRLSPDDRLIAVFAADRNAQFLLASADGTIMHVRAASIPLSNELNSPGEKLFPKRDLQTVALWRSDAKLWIATNQRARLHDAAGVPTGKIKLGKNETLLSLVTR